MPQTVSVNCNSCGASLDVDQSTRFVTCMHCGTNLEVKRNESSVFTQTIEQIQTNTAHTARDVEIIRLEQELERLDREWQMKHSSTGDGDSKSNQPSGPIGVIALVIFLIIWLGICIGGGMAMSSSSNHFPHGDGPPAIFQCMPFLFAILGAIVIGGAIFKTLTG